MNNKSQKQSPKKSTSGSTTVAAAALQDHLARKYQLASSRSLPHSKTSKQFNKAINKCTSNSQSNPHTTRKKNCKEIEYTLDQAPPPLTLAQRLGLVEAPPRLLDDHVWKNIKKASNTRRDSALPCPICQEEFGLSTQVLLSCSHVFHLACLSAFERFSRTKRCPLCRAEHYQKRIIYDGAHHCRHVAATKIQAWWRGHLIRCWYMKYRDEVPPSNPQLRKKHFQKKLSSMTEKMVQTCDISDRQVAQVLREADDSISMMRRTLAHYDIATGKTSVPWEEMRSKASDQLRNDCSVCLMTLLPESSQMNEMPSAGLSSSSLCRGRPLSLLSCGHVLHETCIEALERFTCSLGGSTKPHTPYLCPLCRAPYSRTLLTL